MFVVYERTFTVIDNTKAPRLSRGRFLATSALTAGAAAAAGTLLPVFDGGRAEAAAPRATTTLTVMFNSGELLPAQVAEFERLHPDIKVVQLTDDNTRLSAMLAAGQPPDFVRVNGAQDFPSIVARGLATNLQPYFDKSTVIKQSDLLPVNDLYRWDGKRVGAGPRYGMVKDWSQDGTFWYNKKLFDQAKVPYPSETTPLTYDELLDLGKRLTVRQGSKIQVYGLDTAYEFGFTYGFLQQMLAQQGSTLFNADYTECDFTTPQARKALGWFVRWAQAHVGPSPLDVGDNAFGLFGADRLAIVTFGYWFGGAFVGTQKGDLPSHVGFAPAPQFGSKDVSACFYGTGAWIPAGSRNKDAAWRFMEYFLGSYGPRERVSAGSGLPPFRSLLSQLPHQTAFEQEALRVEQRELSHVSILRFTPYASGNAVQAAIGDALTSAIQGQTSLDAAARQLTTKVNTMLRRGKSLVG